jgi:hypothetical protein
MNSQEASVFIRIDEIEMGNTVSRTKGFEDRACVLKKSRFVPILPMSDDFWILLQKIKHATKKLGVIFDQIDEEYAD